jgi:hypothetical protein
MKRFLSSLPQLSLFVVILALLKLFLYYNNFNVPIKYYVGLPELALQISDDLFILLPLVFFMYFLNLDTKPRQEKIINQPLNTEADKPVTNKPPKGKIRIALDKVMPYVLMGFFICALVVGPLILLFHSKSYTDRLTLVSILVMDIFFFVFITQNEKLEQFVTTKGMTLSLFLAMFLFMFISKTTGEIEGVEKGKFKGTKIITTDSMYISTDSTFFIGQTSNYVFYHNKIDKHTTIIPTTEVKKIELYSK